MYKIPCKNCKGHGTISNFKHVQDGICFKCSGSGFQNVSKSEYESFKQFEEMQKQGKYIVFNNGKTELFQSEKKIIEQYGNFFSGEYGNYSVKINYNDKNIIYTRHTANTEELIKAASEQYNKFQNQEILKKIDICKSMIEGEADTNLIEMINNKIKRLESQLL